MTSPVFGIGRFFEIDEDENTGNNGTTLLRAEFGIIGFGYYFGSTYFSYKNYCRIHNFNSKYAFAIVITLLVLGYSQGIFQTPFFIGLSFMYLLNFNKSSSFDTNQLVFNQIADPFIKC